MTPTSSSASAVEVTVIQTAAGGISAIKDGITITITDPNATASESSITYTFADLETDYSIGSGDVVEFIELSDGTTISFDKYNNTSNAPKYFTTDGKAVRIYMNNSMTVTGAKAITEIVLTCISSSYMGNTDLYATIDANTWTVVNDNTSDSGNTQLRVVSITITYAE